MTVTIDTALVALSLALLGNLAAGVWYLSKQNQITKNHDEYHKEHRADIGQLDQTQREHGQMLAIHGSILERHYDYDRHRNRESDPPNQGS